MCALTPLARGPSKRGTHLDKDISNRLKQLWLRSVARNLHRCLQTWSCCWVGLLPIKRA